MDWGFALVFAVWCAGIAIGILIGRRCYSDKKSQGVLNVDCSDPADGPYLFLELTVPIPEVVSQKQVVFDVKMTQYASQQ